MNLTSNQPVVPFVVLHSYHCMPRGSCFHDMPWINAQIICGTVVNSKEFQSLPVWRESMKRSLVKQNMKYLRDMLCCVILVLLTHNIPHESLITKGLKHLTCFLPVYSKFFTFVLWLLQTLPNFKSWASKRKCHWYKNLGKAKGNQLNLTKILPSFK